MHSFIPSLTQNSVTAAMSTNLHKHHLLGDENPLGFGDSLWKLSLEEELSAYSTGRLLEVLNLFHLNLISIC